MVLRRRTASIMAGVTLATAAAAAAPTERMDRPTQPFLKGGKQAPPRAIPQEFHAENGVGGEGDSNAHNHIESPFAARNHGAVNTRERSSGGKPPRRHSIGIDGSGDEGHGPSRHGQTRHHLPLDERLRVGGGDRGSGHPGRSTTEEARAGNAAAAVVEVGDGGRGNGRRTEALTHRDSGEGASVGEGEGAGPPVGISGYRGQGSASRGLSRERSRGGYSGGRGGGGGGAGGRGGERYRGEQEEGEDELLERQEEGVLVGGRHDLRSRYGSDGRAHDRHHQHHDHHHAPRGRGDEHGRSSGGHPDGVGWGSDPDLNLDLDVRSADTEPAANANHASAYWVSKTDGVHPSGYGNAVEELVAEQSSRLYYETASGNLGEYLPGGGGGAVAPEGGRVVLPLVEVFEGAWEGTGIEDDAQEGEGAHPRCPGAGWIYFRPRDACFARSPGSGPREELEGVGEGQAALTNVQAQERCAALGGGLAKLGSEEEALFVASELVGLDWAEAAFVGSDQSDFAGGCHILERASVEPRKEGIFLPTLHDFMSFDAMCEEERIFICMVTATAEPSLGEQRHETLGEGELPTFAGEGHRAMASSSEYTGRTYQVIVVANAIDTSTGWNGATYTLAVGNPVPGQTGKARAVQGSGTVTPGTSQTSEKTFNLERGCYILYTTAGTRPYEVDWQVKVDGEEYQDASGGGLDFHTFGIGGALCDLGTCYQGCYTEHDDYSTNECASFGDLLAPPTESAGANCTCSSEQELDLRLTCLSRDCEIRAQCYNVGEAIDEIEVAKTLRIESYIELTDANSIDTAAMEIAMAQWLDFDPSYVELTLVNGLAGATSNSASRGRRLGGVLGEVRHGDFDMTWEELVEMGAEEDEQFGERHRGLQTTSTKTFKRLEFLIIGKEPADFEDATTTISAGVKGLNNVLAVQDESTGLNTAEAYTATYVLASEDVPAADVPSESIAGTGGGQGVDAEGQIVATEAPVEEGDFTRSTQFLVGAGLVVVVSFFLSIIACIVCHMKRKERKEFRRRNEPVDGRPKPIQYVDPWGSVARTFQKDGMNDVGSKGSKNVTSNGSRTANGSISTA